MWAHPTFECVIMDFTTGVTLLDKTPCAIHLTGDPSVPLIACVMGHVEESSNEYAGESFCK